MTVPVILALVAAAWLVAVCVGWLVVVPLLRQNDRGDALTGLLWRTAQVYTYVWHRLRFEGRERLPDRENAERGLLVVANHTGSIDPLLIQSGCRFWIRWMMASDMMMHSLDWLWNSQNMIGVDRNGRDPASLRQAIRHLRGGGALGIFPEGRITAPPRELRPFLPGVGLLVSRTHVPVLLVWISGTPDTNKMSESLRLRSHARVVFVGLIDFGDERDPEVISETLRNRLSEVSGWPLNDEVLPPGGADAA